MKKIIIVKWDNQLGPFPLIQYPPDREFPEKEVYLRIWAKSEMDPNAVSIEFTDNNKNYLTLIKKYNNEVFFLILQLNKNEEFSNFRDILLNISDTLIMSINTPTLKRVISEIYTEINEYANLSQDQMLLNLYSDRDRVNLLNIFREGVIDKYTLSKKMKEMYGTSEHILDMLISPFFHLNLIIKEDLPGIPDCLFLINDICVYRLPAINLYKKIEKSNTQADKMYINEVKNYFTKYNIESEEEFSNLARFLTSNNKIKSVLENLNDKKIEINVFLDMLLQDMQTYRELKQKKIIIEIEDFVYPLVEIKYRRFKPLYIIDNIIERYKKNEISTDQFLRHIQLFEDTNFQKT